MNKSTIIYILASCILILTFIYLDALPVKGETPFQGYPNNSNEPKTITQLIENLQNIPEPPYPYKQKEYDCSQMSAYMERQLECRGYNTTISCSLTQNHSWATIHNIINTYTVHIECIPPTYIIKNPYNIEISYNNITAALNGQYPKEWDYWLPPRPASEKPINPFPSEPHYITIGA